jgi:hypothetical protein
MASEIDWETPWRAIEFGSEMSGIQHRLELEVTAVHRLFGKRAIAVGRRVDDDDTVVVLHDGSYANVHLAWGMNEPFPQEFRS